MSKEYCVSKLGMRRGTEVAAMWERLTGAPCPCETGGKCPLGGPLLAQFADHRLALNNLARHGAGE
jgi:Fe2+ transport system protein FeoA